MVLKVLAETVWLTNNPLFISSLLLYSQGLIMFHCQVIVKLCHLFNVEGKFDFFSLQVYNKVKITCFFFIKVNLLLGVSHCDYIFLFSSLVGMKVVEIFESDQGAYLFILEHSDKRAMLLMEAGVRFHITSGEFTQNSLLSDFSMKVNQIYMYFSVGMQVTLVRIPFLTLKLFSSVKKPLQVSKTFDF